VRLRTSMRGFDLEKYHRQLPEKIAAQTGQEAPYVRRGHLKLVK